MIQMVLNNSILNSLGQAALNSRFSVINLVGVVTLLFVALILHTIECFIIKSVIRKS